jgi:hypothetical protein
MNQNEQITERDYGNSSVAFISLLFILGWLINTYYLGLLIAGGYLIFFTNPIYTLYCVFLGRNRPVSNAAIAGYWLGYNLNKFN